MGLPVIEIKKILNEYESIIVHCAGYAKGSGYSVDDCGYLERITKVIDKKPPVSCSTINKYDRCIANYTGHIGVILLPNSNDAISHATPDDAGTTKFEREEAAKNKQSITKSDLISAIKYRRHNKYNELCLYSYDIIGIFFDTLPVTFAPQSNDIDISDMISRDLSEIPDKSFSEKEIYETFVKNKFYWLDNKCFYKSLFTNSFFQKGDIVNSSEIIEVNFTNSLRSV